MIFLQNVAICVLTNLKVKIINPLQSKPNNAKTKKNCYYALAATSAFNLKLCCMLH